MITLAQCLSFLFSAELYIRVCQMPLGPGTELPALRSQMQVRSATPGAPFSPYAISTCVPDTQSHVWAYCKLTARHRSFSFLRQTFHYSNVQSSVSSSAQASGHAYAMSCYQKRTTTDSSFVFISSISSVSSVSNDLSDPRAWPWKSDCPNEPFGPVAPAFCSAASDEQSSSRRLPSLHHLGIWRPPDSSHTSHPQG